MRRIILAVVAVAALAAGAIALAGPGGTTSVTGTFTATTVTKLTKHTCAGPDGTYEFTDAQYSGTATSTDARLNGPITVHARTVYNTTKNLGAVRGYLKIDSSPGGTRARFAAADSNGSLAGGVDGHASGDTSLVGAFSGSFNPATGFSSASIGTGGSGAVLISPKSCKSSEGDQGENQGEKKHGK
jgi:hypothetical protein